MKLLSFIQNLNCHYLDWKLFCDATYIQIHYSKGDISLFSRNQENHTGKYPDIIKTIPKYIRENVTEFIADSEVVAWDPIQQSILPFQVLSTRKRKVITCSSFIIIISNTTFKNVGENIEVHVCVFLFDLLYFNGRSLISETFRTRRDLLRDCFLKEPGVLDFATSFDTGDTEEINQFLDEAIKGKCEGWLDHIS